MRLRPGPHIVQGIDGSPIPDLGFTQDLCLVLQ